MTSENFIKYLDDTHDGIKVPFPKQLRVSPATYGEIFNFIVKNKLEKRTKIRPQLGISIGKHGGLNFKGIELIMGDEKDL